MEGKDQISRLKPEPSPIQPLPTYTNLALLQPEQVVIQWRRASYNKTPYERKAIKTVEVTTIHSRRQLT